MLWSIALLACEDPAALRPERVPGSGALGDCQPGLGIICPWAGAGYGGWNGNDVPRLEAWLSFPMGVAFPPLGPSGRPVIADWNNHMLRAVNETELQGFETVIETHHPSGATYLADGRLIAATDSRLVAWDPETRRVSTFLGEDRRGFALTAEGAPLDFDQPADTALMSNPASPEVDPSDPDVVYFIDQSNERVRRYDAAAGILDTVMGETVDASGDGVAGTPGFCGEGDALRACLSFPVDWIAEPGGSLAVTENGRVVYVADSGNHLIWKLDVDAGRATILSGSPGVAGFADGPAADALWSRPIGLALDPGTGELFVADTDNHRVRAIDLAAGTVETVAGTGEASCDVAPADLLIPMICDGQRDGGDGGPALEATLYRPFGVDLDVDGNLVISDTYDDRIRIVYR